MSSQSSLIVGIFSVFDGKRVSIPSKKSTFPIRYAFYQSAILGLNEISHHADIRIYSPPHDSSLLTDNSLIFLFGRLAISTKSEDQHPSSDASDTPSKSSAVIDAIFHVAFPGDPNQPSYEASIPFFPPFIFAIGHARSTADLLANTKLRAFLLSTSEWVRDEAHPFVLSVAFDTSNPRWANAPVPLPNTAVQVIGRFAYVLSDGTFGIQVEHVTLNLARLNAPQGSTTADTNENSAETEGESPRKRSRFLGKGTTVLQPGPSPSVTRPIAAMPSTPRASRFDPAGSTSGSPAMARSSATAAFSPSSLSPTPSTQQPLSAWPIPQPPMSLSGSTTTGAMDLDPGHPHLPHDESLRSDSGHHPDRDEPHPVSGHAGIANSGTGGGTPSPQAQAGPSRQRGTGRTTRRSAQIHPAGSSGQASSNHMAPDPQPQLHRPTLRSFTGSLPPPPSTSRGIRINEPSSGMSAKKRGKQPARFTEE
ncbi:hypothetical protein FRC04_002220 [Tulasnella sp. 424]|nr:hypothetical protein FRC04_002220 [Tulasnella sp. 424]KAG8969698.1 hypothetical protein FRC05_000829 [Tulasnella sp. 425]